LNDRPINLGQLIWQELIPELLHVVFEIADGPGGANVLGDDSVDEANPLPCFSTRGGLRYR
jgi:hypothetical protein